MENAGREELEEETTSQIHRLLQRVGWSEEKLRKKMNDEFVLYQCVGTGGVTIEIGTHGNISFMRGLNSMCSNWLPAHLLGTSDIS